MSVIRPGILGGVDGVITSFAIVAGAHSGGLGSDVVLLMGLSSVLADGISMGVSEYLSTIATDGNRKALGQGFACLASFVVNGVVPIVIYISVGGRLVSVALFSVVQLMILGSLRSHVSRENVLIGLSQTSILGTIAGSVAYGVGRIVHAYT
jgi:VIT1/CCC1 family predicted Fe2+/Mn2+ transporter